MNRPFVTVLILTYNGTGFIEDCLRSVLQSRYPPALREVIVADNHSEDGTPGLVRERFSRNVQLVEFDENFGFSRGNNLALEHVSRRTKYLICLNQDTIVHRLWLEELVNTMETNEPVAAAYSAMFVPGNPEFEKLDVNGFPPTVRYLGLTNSYDIRLLHHSFVATPVESGTLGGASFIIRREVINRIGGLFDEDIFFEAEDDELAFRLRRHGYRILMTPTSIVFHRDRYRVVRNHKTAAQICSLMAKAFITTRNRFISFYKNLGWIDFMRVSTVILLKSWPKVREFETETLAKRFYMAGVIILTAISFIAFMFRLPGLNRPGRPPLNLESLPVFPDPD